MVKVTKMKLKDLMSVLYTPETDVIIESKDKKEYPIGCFYYNDKAIAEENDLYNEFVNWLLNLKVIKHGNYSTLVKSPMFSDELEQLLNKYENYIN